MVHNVLLLLKHLRLTQPRPPRASDGSRRASAHAQFRMRLDHSHPVARRTGCFATLATLTDARTRRSPVSQKTLPMAKAPSGPWQPDSCALCLVPGLCACRWPPRGGCPEASNSDGPPPQLLAALPFQQRHGGWIRADPAAHVVSRRRSELRLRGQPCGWEREAAARRAERADIVRPSHAAQRSTARTAQHNAEQCHAVVALDCPQAKS